MKKWITWFCLVGLMIGLVSCTGGYPSEPLLVKTADINANPVNYDQRFLAVKGKVTATGTQPSLQIGWYDFADETGTIAILTTANDTPTVGEELWVSGTVMNMTKIVGQRSLAIFLQEKEKISLNQFPWPLVIGIGLGLIILIVLLIVLLKPKPKTQYQPIGQQYQPTGRPMAPPPPPPTAPPSYTPPAYQPQKSSSTVMDAPKPPARSSSETIVSDSGSEPVFAYLIMKSGAKAGANFPLKKTTIKLGRDGSNDIHVDDKKASREHAKLKLEDGAYTIYDLASSNGTYVNGVKIQTQNLSDSDEIQIGDSVLVFKKV